ncbi:MAG: DUF3536 domain-containing protein [Syntrophobacteraceae bacterium]
MLKRGREWISGIRKGCRSFQAGRSRLAIRRATVTSEVTCISSRLCFGVLHFGDHRIARVAGEYQGAQKYEAPAKEIFVAFATDDFSKTVLLPGRSL